MYINIYVIYTYMQYIHMNIPLLHSNEWNWTALLSQGGLTIHQLLWSIPYLNQALCCTKPFGPRISMYKSAKATGQFQTIHFSPAWQYKVELILLRQISCQSWAFAGNLFLARTCGRSSVSVDKSAKLTQNSVTYSWTRLARTLSLSLSLCLSHTEFNKAPWKCVKCNWNAILYQLAWPNSIWLLKLWDLLIKSSSMVKRTCFSESFLCPSDYMVH